MSDQTPRARALALTPGNAFLLGNAFALAALTVAWNGYGRWLDRACRIMTR